MDAATTRAASRERARPLRIGEVLVRVQLAVLLAIALALALVPFLWIVITSFKTQNETFWIPPTLWPQTFTLENYQTALLLRPFPRFLLNTLLVALPAALLTIAISSLAAYAFARQHFRFAGGLLFLLLVAQMFPGPSLIVPIFDIMHRLNLDNRLPSLTLLYTTFAIPFSTWLLYGYFRTVPRELEDAALIDGCNRFDVFWRVLIPVVTPGLAAVGTFGFLIGWNEFLFALLLMNDQENFTISIGLVHYITEWSTYWGHLGASSVIVTVPVLIIFFLLGQNLIEGLTGGAIKG